MRNSQVAVVASVIANCNRNPKKQKKPFSERDFKIAFGSKKKPLKSEKDKELEAQLLFNYMKMAFNAKEVPN